MVRLTLSAVFVCLAVASAVAQRPAPNPFESAKVLRCSFTAFATGGWSGTSPAVVTDTQDFQFQVSAIDYKKRNAQIVGNTGSALAAIVLTDTGLNVIEQTPIGNFTLTTIFSAGGQKPKFLAVHSRHLGDLTGSPRSSQTYGTCEVTQ
jgi:hypothetical protein